MRVLGDANTRDRDYADVYLLSRVHPIAASALLEALSAVAAHRGVQLEPLGPRLETLHETRQGPWRAFRERVGLVALPEQFSDVGDAVVALLDGVHGIDVERWSPVGERWETSATGR